MEAYRRMCAFIFAAGHDLFNGLLGECSYRTCRSIRGCKLQQESSVGSRAGMMM